MSQTKAKEVGIGITFALLAALGFSFKAILIKLAYPYGITALPLLVLRMLFSLPVFLFLAWRDRASVGQITRRQWLGLALLATVGYYGASLFDFLGLQYISAGLERMILFTYPLLTVLLGVIFLGRKWMRKDFIALVLCYAGIACAVGHDIQLSGSKNEILIGGLWVFLSALCYATYLVGGGHMIAQIGASRFTSLAMVLSSIVVLGHFSVVEPWSKLDTTWQVYALAFCMAIFSTILPVYMLASAIEKIGSSRSAIISSLGPVLTIGFGVVLLDESFSILQGIGVILVIAGVRVASR